MSYSKRKYKRDAFLSGLVPQYGKYLESRDSIKQMEDYMRLRGLDWANIKYPTKTVGWSGYSGYGSLARDTVNFVSKNVGRLYR